MDQRAIIFATLFGPILAVVVTRVVDKMRERRDGKLRIFRILMSTRRMRISLDHVSALNQVEIEFYGNNKVISGWRQYMEHLSRPPAPNAPWNKWNDDADTILAKLLSEMATDLGFNISELDIFKGGYAPEGWRNKENREAAFQAFFLDVANHKNTLPISVYHPGKNSQERPVPAHFVESPEVPARPQSLSNSFGEPRVDGEVKRTTTLNPGT